MHAVSRQRIIATGTSETTDAAGWHVVRIRRLLGEVRIVSSPSQLDAIPAHGTSEVVRLRGSNEVIAKKWQPESKSLLRPTKVEFDNIGAVLAHCWPRLSPGNRVKFGLVEKHAVYLTSTNSGMSITTTSPAMATGPARMLRGFRSGTFGLDDRHATFFRKRSYAQLISAVRWVASADSASELPARSG